MTASHKDVLVTCADELWYTYSLMDPLDREFETCYNTIVVEGAVKISLISESFEQFEARVDDFYCFMEETYDVIRADQSG